MSSSHRTAKAVIRAFNSLSDGEKELFVKDFLKAIPPTAEYIDKLYAAATPPEREAFLERIWQHLLSHMTTEGIQTAVEKSFGRQMDEILREVKEARDRRSDPETIRQNVEICDLRKEDKKKWSLGRLAKKYEMTRQSVARIIQNEEKWRKLLSNLPPG